MKALKEEIAVYPSDCHVDITKYEIILDDALKVLTEKQRLVIYLRFWQPYRIEQVSKHLKISWEAADRLIDQAVETLRQEFKAHKYYKRESQIPNEVG